MTLRVRLVGGLVLLLAVGLSVFGFSLYRTYSSSQYDKLDRQLRDAAPQLEHLVDGSDDTSAPGGPGGGPPNVVAPGTYVALVQSDGTVVDGNQVPGTSDKPAVPDDLPTRGEIITVGSVTGDTTWRLLAQPAQRIAGGTLVVAVPTSDVAASLRRLLLIEVSASVVLLVLLAVGAWFVVRRGLRPLETMASAAGRISAGELSERVEPADGRGEVGQLGLALNTMLDEIQLAFEQRDATEQRLSQFLADASHELRTPLTSIQGFAELFRLGQDRDGLDLPVIMRRIEQESARMRILVDDLLLLARLDQTRPIERVPVDLSVLAADACTDAAAVDRDRTITLDAPGPVVVAGDAAHLRQAIANLVANALRHTPAGTPIEVGAHHDGRVATVTVADHGPGLDPAAVEHVFDRFWQADSARAVGGAGLGLAIVAGIAAEHSGTATAANRDGGGALFTLTLPTTA
jgi:two-component system OmpR family sensor kinase